MLDWSTIINCPGQSVLISDALASPGEFILHDLVSNYARTSDASTVLVSLNATFDHWKTIASHLSPPANLVAAQAANRLTFIGNPLQVDSDDFDETCLHILHNQIEEALSKHLEKAGGQARIGRSIVILDGLSELHWMGIPLVKIKRFTRALSGICQKFEATLVICVHRTVASEHDEMLQPLIQSCTLHVEVLPLSSGRSGAVSGEIAIHHGCQAVGNVAGAICRSRAVQYRLADSGAVYFNRGTGAGVL